MEDNYLHINIRSLSIQVKIEDEGVVLDVFDDRKGELELMESQYCLFSDLGKELISI